MPSSNRMQLQDIHSMELESAITNAALIVPEVSLAKKKSHIMDVTDITGRVNKHLDDMEHLYNAKNEIEDDCLLDGVTDYVNTMEAGEMKFRMKTFLNKYRAVTTHVAQMNDERDDLFNSLTDWFTDYTEDTVGEAMYEPKGNLEEEDDEPLANDPNDNMVQTKLNFEKVKRLNDEIDKLQGEGKPVVHLERERIDLQKRAVENFKQLEKPKKQKLPQEDRKLLDDAWKNAADEICELLQRARGEAAEDMGILEKKINELVATVEQEKETTVKVQGQLHEKKLTIRQLEEENVELVQEIAMHKSDIKGLEREKRKLNRKLRQWEKERAMEDAINAGAAPPTQSPTPQEEDFEQDDEIQTTLLNMGAAKAGQLVDDPMILKARIKDFKSQLERLKTENTSLRADLDKMAADHKEDKKSLESWNEQLRSDMDAKNEANEQMSEEIAELKNKHDKLATSLAEKDSEDRDAAIARERSMMEQFQTEFEHLSAAYEQACEQIRTLKQKLAVASRDLKSLGQRAPSPVKRAPLPQPKQKQKAKEKSSAPPAPPTTTAATPPSKQIETTPPLPAIKKTQETASTRASPATNETLPLQKQAALPQPKAKAQSETPAPIRTASPLPAIRKATPPVAASPTTPPPTTRSAADAPPTPTPTPPTAVATPRTPEVPEEEEDDLEEELDDLPPAAVRMPSTFTLGGIMSDFDDTLATNLNADTGRLRSRNNVQTKSQGMQTTLTVQALNNIMKIMDQHSTHELVPLDQHPDKKHEPSPLAAKPTDADVPQDVLLLRKVLRNFLRMTLEDLNGTCRRMQKETDELKSQMDPDALMELKEKTISKIYPEILLDHDHEIKGVSKTNARLLRPLTKNAANGGTSQNADELLQNFAQTYIGHLAAKLHTKPVSVFKPKDDLVYKTQFDELEKHMLNVIRGVQNLVSYRVYCLRTEKEELYKMIQRPGDHKGGHVTGSRRGDGSRASLERRSRTKPADHSDDSSDHHLYRDSHHEARPRRQSVFEEMHVNKATVTKKGLIQLTGKAEPAPPDMKPWETVERLNEEVASPRNKNVTVQEMSILAHAKPGRKGMKVPGGGMFLKLGRRNKKSLKTTKKGWKLWPRSKGDAAEFVDSAGPKDPTDHRQIAEESAKLDLNLHDLEDYVKTIPDPHFPSEHCMQPTDSGQKLTDNDRETTKLPPIQI